MALQDLHCPFSKNIPCLRANDTLLLPTALLRANVLSVFVKPPSVDELKIRLKKRKTESDEKISMRIAKASVELATAPQFDKIIKNYDLEIALKEAEELVVKHLNLEG